MRTADCNQEKKLGAVGLPSRSVGSSRAMPAGLLEHIGHDLYTGQLAKGAAEWTAVDRRSLGRESVSCEAVHSKVKLLYLDLKEREAAHLSVSVLHPTHRVLEKI